MIFRQGAFLSKGSMSGSQEKPRDLVDSRSVSFTGGFAVLVFVSSVRGLAAGLMSCEM